MYIHVICAFDYYVCVFCYVIRRIGHYMCAVRKLFAHLRSSLFNSSLREKNCQVPVFNIHSHLFFLILINYPLVDLGSWSTIVSRFGENTKAITRTVVLLMSPSINSRHAKQVPLHWCNKYCATKCNHVSQTILFDETKASFTFTVFRESKWGHWFWVSLETVQDRYQELNRA